MATLAHAVVEGALEVLLRTRAAPHALTDAARDLRLPRAIIGIMAGAAFGVVAAILQGATRNPLADPGLLGINAGASLAVVAAISFLGVASPFGFIWFAFGGAALAAIVVFLIGSVGGGASPARLALTGAAVTAATTPLITLLLIRDVGTLSQYRFWSVGSLAGRGLETASVLWPFLQKRVSISTVASSRTLKLSVLLAPGTKQSLLPGASQSSAYVGVTQTL